LSLILSQPCRHSFHPFPLSCIPGSAVLASVDFDDGESWSTWLLGGLFDSTAYWSRRVNSFLSLSFVESAANLQRDMGSRQDMPNVVVTLWRLDFSSATESSLKRRISSRLYRLQQPELFTATTSPIQRYPDLFSTRLSLQITTLISNSERRIAFAFIKPWTDSAAGNNSQGPSCKDKEKVAGYFPCVT